MHPQSGFGWICRRSCFEGVGRFSQTPFIESAPLVSSKHKASLWPCYKGITGSRGGGEIRGGFAILWSCIYYLYRCIGRAPSLRPSPEESQTATMPMQKVDNLFTQARPLPKRNNPSPEFFHLGACRKAHLSVLKFNPVWANPPGWGKIWFKHLYRGRIIIL